MSKSLHLYCSNKIETLLCTDVGTAHQQHGFEACAVLVGLGLCWLKLSALNELVRDF
jgi:hypothetical protein